MALKLGCCVDGTPEAFDLLARIGYRGVQVSLPTSEGDDLAGAAKQLGDLAVSYGLEIVAVNAPMRSDQLSGRTDELNRFCEAAASTGAPFLRGFVPPYIRQPEGDELDFWGQIHLIRHDLSLWEPILRRHGLRLCLEMHDGYITAACSSCWILLHELDPTCFGLVHDAENMVREGLEHWMKGFEILGDYLGYLHVKNMAWTQVDQPDEGYWDMPHNPRKWRPGRTALPDGLVDWPMLVGCLRRRHWNGWLMLEDLRDDIAPEHMLRDDYDYLGPLLA